MKPPTVPSSSAISGYLPSDIIADERHHAVEHPTHCPACHYPRQGLDRDDCPECGSPFTPSPMSKAERQRQRAKAIRLMAIIIAIHLLVSLLPLLAIAL